MTARFTLELAAFSSAKESLITAKRSGNADEREAAWDRFYKRRDLLS